MKDFAKILEEALTERDEDLKKQKELAEEIIERALSRFIKFDVSEVIIIYNEQKNLIVVRDSNAGAIGIEYSNLCYAHAVYSIIKDILGSDDKQIKALEDKLSIMISDDIEKITLKLK